MADIARTLRCKKLTKDSNNVKLLIVYKGKGMTQVNVSSAD
jgi:hypothetical protein